MALSNEKSVKILDGEYPEIKRWICEIRDKKNTGFYLKKKVYELGKIMSEIMNNDGTATANSSLMYILRAGEPLGNGINEVYESDKIAYISAKRDEETLKPLIEYLRIPSIKDTDLILADSMCATGGSILGTLEVLENQKEYCGIPKTVTIVCAISSEYGIEKIIDRFNRKIKIVTGTMISECIPKGIGPGLDNRGYIINKYGKPRDLGDDMFGEPKNQEY